MGRSVPHRLPAPTALRLPTCNTLAACNNDIRPRPALTAHTSTPVLLQEELVKEAAVVYNKEDVLNPYFVVFGKRKAPISTGSS